MTEEKFKVIQFLRELIIELDKDLENFPRKDIELKNRIRNTSYDILEILYESNGNIENSRKEKLLNRAIAKTKVIDFLVNISYDKQLITQKKYLKIGVKLDNIIKYISGWLKSIKK